LIFVAEKGAAESKWCGDELEYWCGTLGRIDHLIILHVSDSIHLDTINNKVDWKKTEALPALLGKYISSIPLYVDVHQLQKPNELTLEHPQYKSNINLISAKLRGVAPETGSKDYTGKL